MEGKGGMVSDGGERKKNRGRTAKAVAFQLYPSEQLTQVICILGLCHDPFLWCGQSLFQFRNPLLKLLVAGLVCGITFWPLRTW
jgi:hypothetical protein